MKKRILIMLAPAMLLFTGCGELKIYESEHTSAKTEIDDIKDFLFEKQTSPKSASKPFEELLIYQISSASAPYRAKVPVTFCGMEGEMNLEFNSDKEFKEWRITSAAPESSLDHDAIIEKAKANIEVYNAIIKSAIDSLGAPDEKQELNDENPKQITNLDKHAYSVWKPNDYSELRIQITVPNNDSEDKMENGMITTNYNYTLHGNIYLNYKVKY